jgi:hypothetical protein
VGDSRRLKVEVHGVGELEEGWADAVKSVWYHFLFGRLKPHVEVGEGGR